MDKNLPIIKSLVGDSITKVDLKHIDAFVSSCVALFIPVGGSCGYAITPDHSHPSYMFVIPYDRESEVFIDGRGIKSHPNSIFCLSPDIKHHEKQNYLPPKYCAIFIQKDFFEEAVLCYHDSLPFYKGDVVDVKSAKLDILIREFIYEFLESGFVLESIAHLLTHEIIRNINPKEQVLPPLCHNLIINEAVKYINIHFEKEISIDQLAKLSHLSSSHFSKLFTQEMQITPMAYLKTVRLQQAKKMLLTKSYTITEVANKCGFNSTSYFAKQFREAFSQTPKEYLYRFS